MTDGEEEEEGISWINAALPKPNAINKCDAVFFVAMGKLILEWDEHNFIMKDLVIFENLHPTPLSGQPFRTKVWLFKAANDHP